MSAKTLPPLDTQQVLWFRRQLRSWSKQHFRDFPWRKTTDPYKIFIAEFLLQKTAAATAAPIYEILLDRYPTLADLSAARVEEIAEIMDPLGLFFRSQRLYDSAQQLQTQFGGQIPSSETELLQLPGVGIYTARSICTNAFGQTKAVLDTNVARIIERFFGVRGERVKSRCKILWGLAQQIAPQKETSRWNLTLLDFGAGVCTAQKPRCDECPLRKRCQSLRSN